MQRLAISTVLGVGCLGVAFLVATAAFVIGGTEPGHMPMHVGCRHDHGAKWHADHGRSLAGARNGRIREVPPDRESLSQRSLTAGRSGGAGVVQRDE